MRWTFEKAFYGKKDKLSVRNIKQFLVQGFCPIPNTLFEGYYKTVYRVGDHDGVCSRIERPFPDAVTVQKPEGRFALHFSGGYDSSLLAKLYDSEDVDYIHFVGSESPKARALAASLKGTLHEMTLTPEVFIETAEKILPQLREPYPFNDVVFAYVASEKAKELGHTLVLTGDGGDPVFGGYNVGIDSGEAVDIWKSLEPHRLLGVETFQPLMHSVLEAWSKTTLSARERTKDKLFLRNYFRELGMPEEVVTQRKVPWAGSLGIREDTKVNDHMNAAIDASDHRWITEFTFPTPPATALLFRQYGLVKWLEANYKKELDKAEVSELAAAVRRVNAADELEARRKRRKAQVKSLIPPFMLQAVQGVRRRRVIRRTV